ncbi:hypothetical protein AAF712_011923 [Marasmius tenuissimus]|uniref:Uncharacterized protein n=1 Tax=Marasmius tenuissimus TaxID=585030 RepID=A0ABR2ZJ61_9AGAR|nr:hypothetical protein PM082_015280 [Marasmius tenuissimus]
MFSKLSAFALVALLPAYTHALVGIDWSMAKTPSSGLKDITFPINMANAAHESGYYYAMQYGFVDLNDVGYTGIQPRPDKSGQSIVHGVFSSFVPGTTTSDSQCTPGADGGPGVSCSVEIPSSYADTYNFVVNNTEGTTWAGTMVDTATGKETHIGSWTLPSGSGGIQSSQVGFVEYYLWNDGGDHPCNTLPKTEVFFGTPTTRTGGAGPGSLGNAYEYGDCVGQVKFSQVHTAEKVSVKVGF